MNSEPSRSAGQAPATVSTSASTSTSRGLRSTQSSSGR